MKASQARAAAPTVSPEAIVVLQPNAFQAKYSKRPKSEIAIGIVVVGEADLLTAVTECDRVAHENGRTGTVAQHRFDEELALWTVGLAACDPNDATAPYFECGADTVRHALTPDAIAHLCHEAEAVRVAASPTRPEATDDDVNDLSFRLAAPGALSALGAGEHRARRWLRFVLDELRKLDPPDEAEVDGDEDAPPEE